MAFEDIECVNPVNGLDGVPPDGVRVKACKLGGRGGRVVHYIQLKIGAKLAAKISLAAEKHQLRLLFGTDVDAGKIKVSVDNAAGRFLARRDKNGNYALTINAASADGLFALDFPVFAVVDAEPIRPANGQPPHFVFRASTEMLAVDD